MVYGYAHDPTDNFRCNRCKSRWVYVDKISGLGCIEITCVTCGNVWYLDEKKRRVPPDTSSPKKVVRVKSHFE